MLAELKAAGTTVFLTTHDMAEADAVCDRIAILDEGRIVAEGAPESLKLRFARNRVVVTTRTRGVVEHDEGRGRPPTKCASSSPRARCSPSILTSRTLRKCSSS